MDFIVANWYLFVALVVILAMLAAGPLQQLMYGIKSVTPAQAILLVNREDGVFIDVCEATEYREAHIPNSLNIPLSGLGGQAAGLQKYKARPVILSCRSGNRSMRAAVTLRKLGFEKVFSLGGGLLGWQRDNLPVEK